MPCAGFRLSPTCTTMIVAAVACAACARPPAPERFTIRLRAESAPGVPIEGVRAWIAGREVGSTDAHGAASATISGRDGDRVSLAIACPADHHTDTPSRGVPLRRIEAPSGIRPIDVTVRCTPEKRRVALVVRAEGAGGSALPIDVQDARLGQTDADGVAHLFLDAHPGTTLRVKLVTAAHPKLEPHDPVQTFRVGPEDSILLFAQTFGEPNRPVPRTRRVPAILAPHEAPRPYRIQ